VARTQGCARGARGDAPISMEGRSSTEKTALMARDAGTSYSAPGSSGELPPGAPDRPPKADDDAGGSAAAGGAAANGDGGGALFHGYDLEQVKTLVALVCFTGISVLKVQITSSLFDSADYPTAYSLWSCVITCLMLLPALAVSGLRLPGCITRPLGLPDDFCVPKTWAWINWGMLPSLLVIVAATSLDMGFTNIALDEISPTVQQAIAATNPVWTILLESFLRGNWQHPVAYAIISLLVIGAILTNVGSGDELSAYGVTAAGIAVLASATKSVFARQILVSFKKELGALALLFWVDLFMIPVYTIWTTPGGELQHMFDVVFHDSGKFWNLTGTAALGGARALLQYTLLYFLTAASTAVANTATQSINLIITTPIKHHKATAELLGGITVSILGAVLYAVFKLNRSCREWVDRQLPVACRTCPCAKRESGVAEKA